jgi:hypothetical protein
MKILLIGNFAPPYEEENLQNISLADKLVKDGHECTVINISENPAVDKSYIDTAGNADYLFKLVRHCPGKDIIHFSTKGYLRVGLLKLMLSIFTAKLFRAKSIITFHSEFFSILGQMRSPFGGTQTLNTSFFLADKIIYSDRDTYDVATMYKRKENFALIPSFVHIAEDIQTDGTGIAEKLKGKKKVIFFTNTRQTSFLFDILKECLTGSPLPPETAVVISSEEKSASLIKQEIAHADDALKNNLIVLEPHDVRSALQACSRADLIVRPLSCDGETFFERFTLSARRAVRKDNFVYFPNSLVLVKEGSSAEMCADIFNTLLNEKEASTSDFSTEDPCEKIKIIYQE